MDARSIAEGLGARLSGKVWRCVCPVCGDRNNGKFVIFEGRKGPVAHCFGGCDFKDIAKELESRGLWESSEKPKGPPDHKVSWARTFVRFFEDAKKRGETIASSDWDEYRKAKAILREAT